MDKRKLAAIVVVLITVVAGTVYYHLSTENPQPSSQTQFRKEFGDVTVDAIAYNFSPPISMYDALNIALIDDWNATSLQNMTIHVSLQYCRFWSDSIMVGRFRGYETLNAVTQPVANYSAVTVSNGTITSTYRYIWDISITRNNVVPGCPNPEYHVDASTAEIIPIGPVG